MKYAALLLAAVVSPALYAKTVRVSDFGFDAEDSTRFLQEALDSGAEEIVVDRQPGTWITRPLIGRSNQRVVLEEGATIAAKKGEYVGIRDFMIYYENATNVAWVGLGSGATVRMNRKDYWRAPYVKSEWRHALRFKDCDGVLVENLTVCESGGDGLVVAGDRSRNVTVRNCVFDANHRNNITIGTCENLLIEGTVMKNAHGTAPQAGIDFEGDHATARYVNCVMRNCTTENNGGCGYSFYCASSDATSEPLSIVLEDCRSVGDAQGFDLGINHPPSKSYPRGYVRMDRCMFADTRGQAIWTETKCAGTPRLDMHDCVVTNAGTPALFGTLTWECEPPDGMLFDNLTVFLRRKSQPWLSFPQPPLTVRRVTDVRGCVRLVEPDGVERTLTLDQAWCDATFPPTADAPLPSRGYPPEEADSYSVRDSAPGRRVELPSNLVCGHVRYVFFAEKAGRVEFAGLQRPAKPDGLIVKGHPDYMIKVEPYAANGLGIYGKEALRVPVPGTNETVFAFDVPRRGLYQMSSRIWGSAFTLTESSVPVALDAIGRPTGFKSADGAPISLYVPVDGRAESCILVAGLGGAHGAIAALADAHGSIVAESDASLYWNVFRLPVGASGGFYTLSFRAQERWPWKFNPRIDSTGAPLFFFLSPEKTFVFDSRRHGRAGRYTKVEVGEP